MTIKDKILAVLSAIGAVFSAIFFVLFRQAKEERKAAELKAENAAEAESRIRQQTENYVKEQKENEELLQRTTSGNTSDSANATIELLHKLAGKGQDRNKNS